MNTRKVSPTTALNFFSAVKRLVPQDGQVSVSVEIVAPHPSQVVNVGFGMARTP